MEAKIVFYVLISLLWVTSLAVDVAAKQPKKYSLANLTCAKKSFVQGPMNYYWVRKQCPRTDTNVLNEIVHSMCHNGNVNCSISNDKAEDVISTKTLVIKRNVVTLKNQICDGEKCTIRAVVYYKYNKEQVVETDNTVFDEDIKKTLTQKPMDLIPPSAKQLMLKENFVTEQVETNNVFNERVFDRKDESLILSLNVSLCIDGVSNFTIYEMMVINFGFVSTKTKLIFGYLKDNLGNLLGETWEFLLYAGKNSLGWLKTGLKELKPYFISASRWVLKWLERILIWILKWLVIVAHYAYDYLKHLYEEAIEADAEVA